MSRSSAERWAETRTFHHSLYPPERIAAARGQRTVAGRTPGAQAGPLRGSGAGPRPSVSVCLPARECAGTVGAIVTALVGLRELGAIDEIVVIDAASADGTAEVARRAGATVHQEAELLAEWGPVLGKGDAMWRSLAVLEGELVCFLDADSEVRVGGEAADEVGTGRGAADGVGTDREADDDLGTGREGFPAHFATGLLGPLIFEPGVQFVKAFYRRPFVQGGVSLAEGGGRVNHLMARPALALFYPELAGVRQPLAGEVAARRELLERLPFATGYGVEIAMLIDAWRDLDLEGFAQVDLGVHHNPHQPLQALTPMAYTVLATIARRLEREGRLRGLDGDMLAGVGVGGGGDAGAGEWPLERPPFQSLGAVR
jgi:glucosyl-3-phosphoglycerate synthase